MIKLIAGLGNPGAPYQATRHNAGFWFIHALAQQADVTLAQETRFHGLVGRIQIDGQALWLIAPQTFMNCSGQAISALAKFHRISTAEILVVHDELDLLPGSARLKLGGGSGGHNGLKDIIAHLGENGFWRLRLGIGHPRNLLSKPGQEQQDVAAYVLKPPRAEEEKQISDAITQAQNAIKTLIKGDSAQAMQTLHTLCK